MRTVVHLSDLHFGAIDDQRLAPLAAAITELSPELVAVSGDLTQRARVREFHQAREFLDGLARPLIVVPGNHDVPLYDLATRLVDPLGRFYRLIDADPMPVFEDAEIVVIGLNTARSLGGQSGGGRLSRPQVLRAADRLAAARAGTIKIVVTHHPFDVPPTHATHFLVGRAEMAMAEFARVGADLLLAGHLHVSHVGHTAERYHVDGHSALVIQAGTLSRRGRGEPNTFNVLRVDGPRLSIDRMTWHDQDERFVASWTGEYERTDDGWRPAPARQS